MIKVVVALDENRVISSLEVTGHAEGRMYGQLVCASLSFFVRTVARSIERLPSVIVEGGADHPGDLRLKICSYPSGVTERLQSLSDLYLLGIRDLSLEYPKEVKVLIKDINLKGVNNGT